MGGESWSKKNLIISLLRKISSSVDAQETLLPPPSAQLQQAAKPLFRSAGFERNGGDEKEEKRFCQSRAEKKEGKLGKEKEKHILIP